MCGGIGKAQAPETSEEAEAAVVALKVEPPQGDAAPVADEAQELAKKLSNPVASLISVPLQANHDFGVGLSDRGTKSTLNIQPVVPISISKDANLIIRTILPIVHQNEIRGSGTGNDFGLGDTVLSLFYSPKSPTSGGIIWGAVRFSWLLLRQMNLPAGISGVQERLSSY